MSSLKSSRGSVLVFSLIILSIILSAAITVATVSVTNQRSASSTGKSVQSFQVADSGIELALQKIYKGNYATLNALATGMGGAASCTGGAISKNNVVGGSIKVSFYDNDGNLVTCTDTAWRDKVVRIKSEGAAFGTTRVVETAVAAKKPLKKKVLSVGFNYGCVILQNGNVDCWGDNTGGQANDMAIGNAISLATWLGPTCALQSTGNAKCSSGADYTGGRAVFFDEAISNAIRCAILDDGNVDCWSGAADYMGGNAVSVDTDGFSVCAVLSNGNVDCWGNNIFGQANDYAGGNAIDVDVTGGTTCFLLSNGNVQCQGSNGDGQALGHSGGLAISVDVGDRRACALLQNGNVDCWGRNTSGQSNDYTGGDAIAIDAWLSHTCALLQNGNVTCWGANTNGQSNPYTGGDAVAIDTGDRFTCALLQNRNVTCWGDNALGQTTGHIANDARLPGE